MELDLLEELLKIDGFLRVDRRGRAYDRRQEDASGHRREA
jgi:hypothetical protein